MFNHQSHSLQKSSIHIKTSGGLSGRFVSIVCHACHEAVCAEACHTGALKQRKGGGVVLDAKLCMGCKHCSEACTALAAGFDDEKKLPIICHHCGLCVNFCPHNCLKMEVVPDDL